MGGKGETPMMEFFRYDFGYEWPWTAGHLIAATVFGLGTAAAWLARWRTSRWILAALTVWAIAGALIVNLGLRFSLPVALPTEAFLPGGSGRVVDLGAGSGRATVMVLQSRPGTTVTAVDIFSQSYGIGGNSPERLRRNVAAAGAADRLEVRTSDIRELPFEAATFDGAVSVAVIDHLNREGIRQALGEVRRVLKPGGDFLLGVINPDLWIRVAFPMLAEHGYFGQKPRPEFWRDELTAAGLDVIETTTEPGGLYLLARVPAKASAR
jgi:SAM-dependent methyltransferase